MACFFLNTADTKVSIPSYCTQDGVEYFLIKVNCWQDKEWTVSTFNQKLQIFQAHFITL